MTKRLTIATAVLLALAGAGYLLCTNIGPANRPMTVTAQFDEASGLYPGNAVEILGMRVGTVTKVTPADTYVEVSMDIDKGVKVPADAMAATISTSILTDRRVALSPPYTGGRVLKDHDLIPLGRTRTPVGFDRVLAMIDKLTSAIRGDGKGKGPLGDLLTIGATVAEGNGDNIKAALDELSKALRMTTDGAVTKENLTTIITSMSSLTKAMADNDATIRKFGSLVHSTSDVLAEENFGTGTTGKKINEVLQQAADLLDRNRDTISQVVHNGNVIATSMNDKQRELAETFDVLPLMLDNFYNAVDPVNGSLHVHALIDKIQFDSQLTKEICNLMGLRQLGCSTGLPQDYGPDFGLTYMLDSMARMGQGQ